MVRRRVSAPSRTMKARMLLAGLNPSRRSLRKLLRMRGIKLVMT